MNDELCSAEWVGLRPVKRCGLPDPPPGEDLAGQLAWHNALHARTGAEVDTALVASMSARLATPCDDAPAPAPTVIPGQLDLFGGIA